MTTAALPGTPHLSLAQPQGFARPSRRASQQTASSSGPIDAILPALRRPPGVSVRSAVCPELATSDLNAPASPAKHLEMQSGNYHDDKTQCCASRLGDVSHRGRKRPNDRERRDRNAQD